MRQVVGKFRRWPRDQPRFDLPRGERFALAAVIKREEALRIRERAQRLAELRTEALKRVGDTLLPQNLFGAARREFAKAHPPRAEAVVRIAALDEKDPSPALPLRDAQRVLRPPEQAEHHRVIRLFRHKALHIAAEHADTTRRKALPHRPDRQRVGVHRRDRRAVRQQRKAQKTDAAARVAHVRVFGQLRRDVLRDNAVIIAHIRRVAQERDALLRPVHPIFLPFAFS